MAKKGSSSSADITTSNGSAKDMAFTGLGNLIKLLPTGTIFMFQFLTPLLSNNGQCHPVNKYLMGALLVVSMFNCAASCFTDSYTDADGNTRYGIATRKGMWPRAEDGEDLARYRVRFSDYVHAFFCVIVFSVLAVLDHNTVRCFAPALEKNEKLLMMVLPTVVGLIASAVFAFFPSTRHGIGYPATSSS